MSGVVSRNEETASEHEASAPARSSPYKGLTPYAAQDAAYFFGRDAEREIITANLRVSRLTVLYGASGVGKSSLLNAGVIGDLRRLAESRRARRGVAPVIFGNWHEPDVVAALSRAIRAMVSELTGEPAPPATGSLADDLAAWADAVHGDVLLIFDQFEEYFLYHPDAGGDDGFDAQLARAVSRPDLHANVLIAIREDAITRLDRFKGRIPGLFDNYLRVRHLDDKAARSAIEKPLERFNLDGGGAEPVSIEPELVDLVLDQVKTGRVLLKEGGSGGVKAGAGAGLDDARIETPFLQLVMTRLWDVEMQAGSRVLRRETLVQLGGAEQIVHSHLDQSLSTLSPEDRDVAARVFRQLVTPSGMKVAYTPADLAEYAGTPEDKLLEVLEHLSHGSVRILRAVPDESGHGGGTRYEIFHDVLAAPILDWRRRYFAEVEGKEREREKHAAEREREEAVETARHERRRARVFRAVAVASGVLAIGVAVVAVLAVQAKQEARAQQSLSQAALKLGTDPAESLRDAARALGEGEGFQAEQAVQTALSESRLRAVFGAHTEPLVSAAYSRDGRRIATASDDGTVRIWEPATGRPLAVIRGHEGPAVHAEFTRSGDRVISGGQDGTVRVSDAATGRPVGTTLEPDGGLMDESSVAVDPTGTRIATEGPLDGGAPLYDAETGEQIDTIGDGGNAWSVAFSPDGGLLATGGDDGVVRVWGARTGTLITALHADTEEPIMGVEFSPNGRALVSDADGGDVSVWNDWRNDRDGVSLYEDPDGPYPHSPRFSPDGTKIVTILDKKAQIWRTRGRQLDSSIATLQGNRDAILDARFADDGRIVTAGRDGSVRVWSTDGDVLAELRGHSDAVPRVSIGTGAAGVVTASVDGTARVWDIAPLVQLRGHADSVTRVQFSGDGRRLLTTSDDGTARIWDRARVRQTKRFKRDFDLSAAALTPDGERVVIAKALAVTVSDIRGGPAIASWKERGWVTDVSVSPDGRSVISAVAAALTDEDNASSAVIRDLASRRPTATLKGHSEVINSVRFSPDGRFVAAASDDATARIWRTSGGRATQVLSGHSGFVWTANWSADGRRIVTAGNDGTVRIWNAASGASERVLAGFQGPVKAAVFARGDRWVVAAGNDGTTRIWEAATGRPLAIMHQHPNAIGTVAVSPDGTIATGSDDKTVALYRCDTCGDVDDLRELAERRLRYIPDDG